MHELSGIPDEDAPLEAPASAVREAEDWLSACAPMDGENGGGISTVASHRNVLVKSAPVLCITCAAICLHQHVTMR